MVQSFFVWFLGQQLATLLAVMFGIIGFGVIVFIGFSVAHLCEWQRWPWQKEEKK